MWFKDKKMLKAIQKGNVERAQECLDAGAQVTYPGWSRYDYLRIACENNDKEMVKFLLDNKTYINCLGVGPMQIACTRGHLSIVKMILDAGGNINALSGRYTYSQLPPIMYAAKHGQVDVVKELIERNARLDIQRKDGLDVFSVASTDEVKAILEPYKPKNTPRKFSYVKKDDRKAGSEENRAGWHMISDDEIAHITVQKEITQEVREVFNFVSKQVTTVVENTNTKTISQPLKESFEGYLDKNKLDRACEKQDKHQVFKAS